MELNFSIEEVAQTTPPAKLVDKTASIADVHFTAMSQTIDEDLSVSRNIQEWLGGEFEARNRTIDEALASGELPETYKQLVGNSMSYGRLAQIAKTRYGLDIQNDDDVYASIRDDMKLRHAYAQEVDAKTPGYLKPFKFTGAMHGYMLDPISVVGMLVGIGPASKAATYLGRIATTAGRTSVAIGVEEAIIQAPVYSWKQDIGVEYNVSDALVNITSAMAGGAILGGAVKTADELVQHGRKFVNSHEVARAVSSDPVAKEAKQILENVVDEAEQLAPDKNIQEHFEEVADAVKAYENAGPRSDLADGGAVELDDDSITDMFKTTVADEKLPYVEEVTGLGADKQIVVGDAVAKTQQLDKQLDQLDAFNKCLKGV